MSPSLPTLSGNQLHLWPIIREALAFPWQYRHAFWKWVLVCGVLVGLTDFAAEILSTKDIKGADGLFELLYHLVLIVLHFALKFSLYTVFCIRCHRLVLLDSTTEPDLFPPQFGQREVNFYRFLLIIFGCIGLVYISGAVIYFSLTGLLDISDTRYEGWILLSLLLIPLTYLLGRCCMVFPATAIDLQPSLTWAWEQSKDFAWRLGILAGILPWLFSFLYNDPHTRLFFGLDQYPFIYSLITGLLWFICTTIEVAVLSIAFRELSGWKNLQNS